MYTWFIIRCVDIDTWTRAQCPICLIAYRIVRSCNFFHLFIQSISIYLSFSPFCPWLRDSWKCVHSRIQTHIHRQISWTIFTMHFISMCASSIYQFDEIHGIRRWFCNCIRWWDSYEINEHQDRAHATLYELWWCGYLNLIEYVRCPTISYLHWSMQRVWAWKRKRKR